MERMDMIRTNRCNKLIRFSQGMTLIELMIAVVIIGVLAGIAYPAYTGYVKEAHRNQAMADMAKIQLYLEEHYHLGYSSDNIFSGSRCLLCDTAPDRYTLAVKVSGASYTISATPVASKGQNTDECRGHRYTKLELKSTGERTPTSCW